MPQTAPPTPAPESAVLFADTAETVAVPGPAAAPEDRLAALVVAVRRLAAAGRHGGFGGVPPAADADADDGADCAAGLQLRPLLQLRLRRRLLPPPLRELWVVHCNKYTGLQYAVPTRVRMRFGPPPYRGNLNIACDIVCDAACDVQVKRTMS